MPNIPIFAPGARGGLSAFDIRHNFVTNALWQIPSPKTQSTAVNWLAGGWQLGEILQGSSGVPFTPLLGGRPLRAPIARFAYDFPDRAPRAGCNHRVNPGH